MKARYLAIIFIAAVIVPSILLAVLSIRSAGREEAWMEKQIATTLDAEVTHTAGLAGAEVRRITDELRAGLDVPIAGDYARTFSQWKTATPMVAVPFLLSPRFGILWPPSDTRASLAEKKFLKENGEFLSDKTATAVLQNIAVRYQGEILKEETPSRVTPPASSAQVSNPPPSAPPAQEQARSSVAAGAPAAPAASSTPGASVARQQALDAFAQNPALQSKVYAEAREKGDLLNARNVEPMAAAPSTAAAAAVPSPQERAVASGAETEAADGTVAGAADSEKARAEIADETMNDLSRTPNRMVPAPKDALTLKKAPVVSKAAVSAPVVAKAAPQEQPSQFVITSQLLSQIASQGDFGLIPRFIGEKLVFLFWARQKDGRIAGCEVADAAFRARIAGVLSSTWTPVRVLTLLDETGAPLAAPPDTAGINWRRPFVAREIGESLPRWEAAAYLTRPDSITAQARTSSLVIWIMVVILFVSVAGGGTMVLSSVYGEMRLAQQKATFVTNVSHELKTPLTSISLFVDLLRRKGPLPASKKEQYLSLMASETERLTRLINNVLDFSRDKGTRRYAMRTVDASEVTAQIVESQRVRLESRGFSLSLEAAPRGVQVSADAEALKQVLLNLLSNAEKYSTGTKEIAVTVAGERDSVLITVADRGIGVSEKDREKVFQEFYRVDDSLSSGVQGTGLGLTIARRIARDHGGDITCSPREGGGTKFVVRLPKDVGGAAAQEVRA